MDISGMFPIVGSIAVICYAIGEAIKATRIDNKFVPIIVAIIGGLLGAVGQLYGLADFAELNIFDAVATGICSGIVSSGAYSLIKNITGGYEKNWEEN